MPWITVTTFFFCETTVQPNFGHRSGGGALKLGKLIFEFPEPLHSFDSLKFEGENDKEEHCYGEKFAGNSGAIVGKGAFVIREADALDETTGGGEKQSQHKRDNRGKACVLRALHAVVKARRMPFAPAQRFSPDRA